MTSVVEVEIYENQRWLPIFKRWKTFHRKTIVCKLAYFTDKTGKIEEKKEDYLLPENFYWLNDWQTDNKWLYYNGYDFIHETPKNDISELTNLTRLTYRRRRWFRQRTIVNTQFHPNQILNDDNYKDINGLIKSGNIHICRKNVIFRLDCWKKWFVVLLKQGKHTNKQGIIQLYDSSKEFLKNKTLKNDNKGRSFNIKSLISIECSPKIKGPRAYCLTIYTKEFELSMSHNNKEVLNDWKTSLIELYNKIGPNNQVKEQLNEIEQQEQEKLSYSDSWKYEPRSLMSLYPTPLRPKQWHLSHRDWQISSLELLLCNLPSSIRQKSPLI